LVFEDLNNGRLGGQTLDQVPCDLLAIEPRQARGSAKPEPSLTVLERGGDPVILLPSGQNRRGLVGDDCPVLKSVEHAIRGRKPNRAGAILICETDSVRMNPGVE